MYFVTLPPSHYGSEPLFAPAKNSQREDDGYILEVVYDGFEHMSELQRVSGRQHHRSSR
ncbi:MAG: hypothetical protein E2O61_03295 [Gammaproteobacteria bacterium]|nr:MAG: hypothetical protein E2O61_03295 [Gammaproteobacteria bacterium]